MNASSWTASVFLTYKWKQHKSLIWNILNKFSYQKFQWSHAFFQIKRFLFSLFSFHVCQSSWPIYSVFSIFFKKQRTAGDQQEPKGRLDGDFAVHSSYNGARQEEMPRCQNVAGGTRTVFSLPSVMSASYGEHRANTWLHHWEVKDLISVEQVTKKYLFSFIGLTKFSAILIAAYWGAIKIATYCVLGNYPKRRVYEKPECENACIILGENGNIWVFSLKLLW